MMHSICIWVACVIAAYFKRSLRNALILFKREFMSLLRNPICSVLVLMAVVLALINEVCLVNVLLIAVCSVFS